MLMALLVPSQLKRRGELIKEMNSFEWIVETAKTNREAAGHSPFVAVFNPIKTQLYIWFDHFTLAHNVALFEMKMMKTTQA